MKQVPASLLTLIAGVVITLISLWVGQHHGLLPEQASEQAPLVDGFFNLMVTIATALFLIVEGAIVIFAIQFRKRKGDETDGEPIEGNFSLEVVWTAIPAIIVIGLGVYSVAVYEQMGGFSLSMGHDMVAHHHSVLVAQAPSSEAVSPLLDEAAIATTDSPKTTAKYGLGATPEEVGNSADVIVNVTGLQYAWIFNYPDEGITTGELHIPLGKDVLLNLTAQDVIHSFWMPQFRLKQDALPGQPTQLRFVATKIGAFPVVCAELCGGYHGSMRTQVIVHSPEDYAQWLSENRIAQKTDTETAIAHHPADLPKSDFLAPYADEWGVEAKMVSHLHS
jgi:cytochrome c oxidase subunit 2